VRAAFPATDVARLWVTLSEPGRSRAGENDHADGRHGRFAQPGLSEPPCLVATEKPEPRSGARGHVRRSRQLHQILGPPPADGAPEDLQDRWWAEYLFVPVQGRPRHASRPDGARSRAETSRGGEQGHLRLPARRLQQSTGGGVMGYIFGSDTGFSSPEELDQRRALIRALMANSGGKVPDN